MSALRTACLGGRACSGLSGKAEQPGKAQPGFLPLAQRSAAYFWKRFTPTRLIGDKIRVRFSYKLEGKVNNPKIFFAKPIFQGEKGLEFRLKACGTRRPQA